jgi:multicomponent Na+:H+ antiporter subunit F
LIAVVLLVALVTISVAIVLSAYRALKGPTVADRVVALDAVLVGLMGLLVIGSMLARTDKYLAYVLVMAVLSYIATVAFAKYVERGVVIERDVD